MRFNAVERRILVVSWLGHFLAHFYMIMQAVLVLKIAPEFARDFGYSTGSTYDLTILSFALFGVGSFPAGLVTDRWRARWMLMICMIGCGACSALAGLAGGPIGLCLALSALGLFASIYHPAGLTLISRHVRARGWALGINGVAGNLGVAMAPFAAAVVADLWGWRTAFVALGLPGVVIGLGCLWLGALRIAEPAAPRTSPPAEPGANYRLYFLIVCVGLIFGGLGYRTAMTGAPALFVEKVELLRHPVERLMHGLGLTDWQGRLAPGSIMLSLAVVIGCVGQLLGGYLADRHDLRLMYLLFYALAVPVAFLCAAIGEWWLFLAFIVLVFFTMGMQSIENSLISRITPDRWRSTGFGLKFVLTFGAGALGVRLTGHVIDANGSAAFVFVYVGVFTALVALTTLVLYLVSRRPIPRLGQQR
jgi:FSR family fosmidomycin resistance protein-like MFS transporter